MIASHSFRRFSDRGLYSSHRVTCTIHYNWQCRYVAHFSEAALLRMCSLDISESRYKTWFYLWSMGFFWQVTIFIVSFIDLWNIPLNYLESFTAQGDSLRKPCKEIESSAYYAELKIAHHFITNLVCGLFYKRRTWGDQCKGDGINYYSPY